MAATLFLIHIAPEFICNQRLNKGSCCHVDPGAQSHILCPRDRRLSDAAGRHGNQSRLLCWPCQRPAPFCPDPFHLWRHTFPWGDFAHNICPVFQPPGPTHCRGASGLAFLNKGRPRTHLLRGLEVDTLSQSGGGRGGHSQGEKTLVLTLAGRKKHSAFLLRKSLLFARPLRTRLPRNITSSPRDTFSYPASGCFVT